VDLHGLVHELARPAAHAGLFFIIALGESILVTGATFGAGDITSRAAHAAVAHRIGRTISRPNS
jgi:low temperature requirement protein LtrA